MNFLLDNNLPPKLAYGLREFAKPDHTIYHLKDLFAPEAKDVDWLTSLDPQHRWVILTGDLNIGRKPMKSWHLSKPVTRCYSWASPGSTSSRLSGRWPPS